MTNNVLDEIAREEIRAAMTGLRNKQASTEAARLAMTYRVSINTIYNATNDLRPKRKTRKDKGKRVASLTEDEGLRHCAELVTALHLAPALALENAKLNGMAVDISEATLRRYLNEHGISRRQRMNTRRPHRRFEADKPGSVFQFDISGLKSRWYEDVRSRKIIRVSELEVSVNHPNADSNRVQVWAFALVDDHSRRRFTRYVAVDKPNSTHVAQFLLQAFREMGVPLKLYTDGDKIIHSKRMQRAVQLLDKAFESSGGFVIEKHAPGNSQATGKVEVAHRWIEEHNRLLGINDERPSIETLNTFAVNMSDRFNHRIHSTTGETPIARWQNTRSVFRVPPPATLDAAFMAQEFTVTLRADLTIKIKGDTLQLPREGKLLDWAALGHKVTVVLPHQADWLVVIGQDGTEVICDHSAFKADNAGDFKAVPDTAAEALRKSLKETRKAKLDANKASGERFAIQLLDQADEIARPLSFPKPTVEISAEKIAAIPGASTLAGKSGARHFDYFDAIDWMRENKAFEDAPDAASIAWLKAIFGPRELVEENELQTAWDARPSEQTNVIPMHKLKLA